MLVVLLICMLLYWMIGLFVLALPMAIRLYRQQFKSRHMLSPWEWAVTIIALPLFWPVLVYDLYTRNH